MSVESLSEQAYTPATPIEKHMSFPKPGEYVESTPEKPVTVETNGESQYQEEFQAAVPPPVPVPVSNVIKRKLTGFVGFANLPNQWHRRSVRKGFQFTLMVVGESGLGKSTMVNTLLNNDTYGPKSYNLAAERADKTVATKSMTANVQEDGVNLELTVVDTPGFGDFVNNEESWKPIVDRIEAGYDSYLEAENSANRTKIRDERIHACIFFIDPTGHSLKPIEIEFMRRLHHRVNLIPVIAKSDTLTEREIVDFKARILADIEFHRIRIFQAPRYELDDEETVQENREIMSKIPFAVVGSNTFAQNGAGLPVRCRSYPWGMVEVDNEDHCDFAKLRQMLIRTHMEDLKDYTKDVLYENYRSEKLTRMGVSQDQTVFKEISPQAKMEEERVLHEAKLAKMETEMGIVFQQKVLEKETKLKQSEEELYARHREMKDNLEKQRLELEDKKAKWERGIPLQEEKGKRGKFTLGRSN